MLVTGASHGVGLETACAFARAGSAVVLCARDPERLDTAVARVHGVGAQRAIGYSADFTHSGDVEDAIGMAQEHFGHVDVLVNVVDDTPQFGRFDDLADKDWYDVLEFNVLSVVRACRAVLPAMRARGWGRIVNVAPNSSTVPNELLSHSAAAKAALLQLTRSLARQTASQDISVNVVSPAFVPSIGVRARVLLEDLVESDEPSEEAAFVDRFPVEMNTAGPGSLAERVAAVVTVLGSALACGVSGADVQVNARTSTTS